MRRLSYFAILVVMSFAVPANADKPATPTTRTEEVGDGKFIFVVLCPPDLETERGKAIREKYPQGGLYKNDGSKEPLWTIDWFRWRASVLPDGVHMVRYGFLPSQGAGFTDRALTKQELKQEAVSFFANGKLLREYSIGDLVDDPTKLPRSVSHFEWLKSSEILEPKLQLDLVTIDGNRIRFDLTTGKIESRTK